MIKKILFSTLISILFLSSNLYAKEIILAYVDFPPYEYQEEGQPNGVLIDIVQSIFEKAGIPLKLEFMSFKQAYINAKEGKIDGLFNFYKTKQRLKHFDYSEPIIENPLIFFVRKDSALQFHRPQDLKGLKIGVISGYTYGEDFDNSKIFVKKETDTHLSNFKRLVLGRIDAYPCDKLVGLNTTIKNNLMSELKILPAPLKVMDGYIGFTKNKNKKEIKKINIVIKEMHQNGEIDNVINKYIEDML